MRCHIQVLGIWTVGPYLVAVWGGLSVALMEEVSHLRVDFEVLKVSGSFYLVLSASCLWSEMWASSCLLPSWTLTPWQYKLQINSSLCKLLWSWCFITEIKKEERIQREYSRWHSNQLAYISLRENGETWTKRLQGGFSQDF